MQLGVQQLFLYSCLELAMSLHPVLFVIDHICSAAYHYPSRL